MSEKLLRVTEAAERLAVAPATVRKWLWLGRLTGVHVGRALRLRESDVDAMARVGFNPGRQRAGGR